MFQPPLHDDGIASSSNFVDAMKKRQRQIDRRRQNIDRGGDRDRDRDPETETERDTETGGQTELRDVNPCPGANSIKKLQV